MSADGLPPGSVRKRMFAFANELIGDGEIMVTPYLYSHVQLHHVAVTVSWTPCPRMLSSFLCMQVASAWCSWRCMQAQASLLCFFAF